MPRDLGIADRLRAFGLTVVEVDGWQARGTDYFFPRGSVNHHTAGTLNGNAPSLGICINGRPDVPGPLCNTLQARDNTIYLIAAGRANHAGTGSWKGLKGNSTVYGHEIENAGTDAEPLRPDQILTAARVHAAFNHGRIDASMVCQHKEWTKRKVDAHGIDGLPFRALVAAQSPGPFTTPSPEEEVMVFKDGRRLIGPSDPSHPNYGQVWLEWGLTRVYVPDEPTLAGLRSAGIEHVLVDGDYFDILVDPTPVDVDALADAIVAKVDGIEVDEVKAAVKAALREGTGS